MANAPENLVWETSTDTSSPFTLTTVARSFNDAFGTGGTDTFWFFMYNRSAPGEWMVATGHLSAATTLVIDTVIEGSNGTSPVAWSAGIKDITNDVSAAEQFYTSAPTKATPVDADSMPLVDSAASNVAKRVTWSNVKATLKTYFDTLYQPLSSVLTELTTAFTPASASGPASLKLAEDTDNGSNTVTIIAPASVASNKTATLQDVTGTIYVTGGTDVSVADGGTGLSSATTYAVLCGGTTSTGAFQSIASVGTSGQVLTSNGAGALPTFQDAPAAGATYLGTVSTGSGTTASVTGLGTTYQTYIVCLRGISGSNSGGNPRFALSTNNGSSYGTAVNLSDSWSAGAAFSGILFMQGMQRTGTKVFGGSVYDNNTTSFALGGQDTGVTGAVNAIQFSFDVGNLDAGNIDVWGI